MIFKHEHFYSLNFICIIRKQMMIKKFRMMIKSKKNSRMEVERINILLRDQIKYNEIESLK